VCNVDDVIKTKPQIVPYFAYWRACDVLSGAEVAVVGCRPLTVSKQGRCVAKYRL